MHSQTSILSDAELDFVSGGDKNAKGQTVPHKEPRPPVVSTPVVPALLIKFHF